LALAWSSACACSCAATAAAAADVVALLLPFVPVAFDELPFCCAVVLLLWLLDCCALLDDVGVVLLLWLPPEALALLLPDAWPLDCDVFWLLDDEAAEVDEDDGGEDEVPEDDALFALLLALCDAPLWESMLCCKVCENGKALAASADAPVGEPPDALNSELINESGDMADPVYPVNPLDVRKEPAKRDIKRMGKQTIKLINRVRLMA
jgi:hypothetical protein